jgi:hypothetical protein
VAVGLKCTHNSPKGEVCLICEYLAGRMNDLRVRCREAIEKQRGITVSPKLLLALIELGTNTVL